MPDKWAQYAQQPSTDKWAQYAAPSGPPAAAGLPAGTHPVGLPAGMSLPGLPGAPNPMVDMNAAPSDAQRAATLWGAAHTARQVVQGIVKGAANTSSTLLRAATISPALAGQSDPYLVPGAGNAADRMQQFSQPTNTAQKVGKTAEQIGEFFVPGGAEEDGAAHLAPWLEKALPTKIAAPVARMGTAALGAGTVNTAQGGSFGTGALAGGIGSGIGQGLAAVAPKIAESALNIRKLDRAYKEPGSIGRAILDKTTGLTPGAVADSAQGVLNGLNGRLDSAVDAASIRPNPVRGLLPAPAEEIPLHSSPDFAGTSSQPVTLNQADRPMLRGLPAPSESVPTSSHANIFPDQLPSASSSIRAPFSEGSAEGLGPGQYIGQIPGERGGPGQLQGVLLRRAESEPFLIPSAIPAPGASLSPARSVLSSAIGKATNQGERTTLGQLNPMVTHLGETVDGQPISNDVTPRQLLDLQRGFGNEFIHRWNPETMTGVKGTAAQAYHALGDSLYSAVPEAAPLRSEISTMIPVAKRAESAELNAPTTQRLFQRIAAPTGALTGAVGGGAVGYEHGGREGALEGAGAGLLAPLLLTSPTGQMALARTLNGLAKPVFKGLVGSGLQMSERNKAATTSVPK